MSNIQVNLVDYMGDDNSVVNAARVSFSRTAEHFTDEQNQNLIEYLAKHKHEMPFAHTSITLRVAAPISIRTQCFKHKIGFVENEVSRRYVKSKPKLFVPTFRKAPSSNIKQGSGSEVPSEQNQELAERYIVACHEAIECYNDMINQGVAPEQARFVLPQGVMTEWIWTGSLLAYARFFNLRTTEYAQKEVRDLAHKVGDIIEPLYPISWEALTKDKR